jgi:hypothetical protein
MCLILIIALIIALITTGCSKKEIINYIYNGENESWIAEYKITNTATTIKNGNRISYKNYEDKIFTITYKKDLSELNSINYLSITYDYNNGSSSDIKTYNGNPVIRKTFIFNSHSENNRSDGSNIVDDIVTVTVDIDGEIETFKLKKIE